MLLQLSIEIKPYMGKFPEVSITINGNLVKLIDEGVNVTDTDIVNIIMQGKGISDTELDEFNNILSDKAIILHGIKLAGVEYNIVDIIEYYTADGIRLPYSNYMHCNGTIVISVNKLLHTLPILPECTMSFQEMLDDLFGKNVCS